MNRDEVLRRVLSVEGKEQLKALVHEVWCDGFQEAVDALRDWADRFGNEHAEAIKVAANMIEATKP